MAKNRFYLSPTPTAGATGSFVVTPADTPFANGDIIRAITINVAGTVRWLDTSGVVQNTDILPAGIHLMLATGVYATGTTATGITGWY